MDKSKPKPIIRTSIFDLNARRSVEGARVQTFEEIMFIRRQALIMESCNAVR